MANGQVEVAVARRKPPPGWRARIQIAPSVTRAIYGCVPMAPVPCRPQPGSFMNRFDAIIVGAGQAGPPLAGRLTAAGMTVALIERHLFGGTCVNTGCMPTKTLVASAHAAHIARRASEFGVRLAGPVRVDMGVVKARVDKVVSDARKGVEKWLCGMDRCTVLEGHAQFETAERVRVRDEVLSAPRVFIDVGGRAVVPEFPRIHDIPYLTNTTMLAVDRVPEHLVVIGGSYIGL